MLEETLRQHQFRLLILLENGEYERKIPFTYLEREKKKMEMPTARNRDGTNGRI